MNVTIIGTGYVGLVSAAVLAEIGHDVVCIDVNEEKIQRLRNGECPIFEKGLPELLEKNKHRMRFLSDYQQGCQDAAIIMIAVGTPEKKDGSANLSYVFGAAKEVCYNLDHDAILIVKSTVPIGTNDELERIVQENLTKEIHVEVVSNPEFLSQGTAVSDMMQGYRIVAGCESDYAREKIKALYEPLKQPLVLTDRRSAEMIKYASNDFLALKISYINEIANLCECLGANVEDVATGMGFDPRIGDKFLRAGIGYGGSCFPKDTKALHWMAIQNDYEIKTVKAAITVNENQKFRLLQKAKNYYDSFEGIEIAVLGLAFKPGTDDLREAPSLAIIPALLEDGAKIRAWDPCAEDAFRGQVDNSAKGEIRFCGSLRESLREADLCLILTEWDQVKALTPADFKEMRRPIIIDGRNCFCLEDMENEAIVYASIGRKTVGSLSQNLNIYMMERKDGES